jgi:hypothetical protein
MWQSYFKVYKPMEKGEDPGMHSSIIWQNEYAFLQKVPVDSGNENCPAPK